MQYLNFEKILYYEQKIILTMDERIMLLILSVYIKKYKYK